MDKETIDIYNSEAESIAQLHSILVPHRIYELINQYFIKGEKTADIGCGIGRDTHWLTQQGFPSIGIDASKNMLQQAKSMYPSDNFFQDELPDLNQLGTLNFHNILCSAVLMHLSESDFKTTCKRLLQILNDNGCLVISFRNTSEINSREKGKLYETICIDEFLNFFKENGCTILLQESEREVLRNLTWHNFVIKK